MYNDRDDNGMPTSNEVVLDHNELVAGLVAMDLIVYFSYPYMQGHGRLTMAWDRFRQICIDYQIVPPAAAEIINENAELIWIDSDDGAALKNLQKVLDDFGLRGRAKHIVKMPGGRLLDLAAGCFIN